MSVTTTSAPRRADVDVAVVGGGPAGLAAAIALVVQDRSVTVSLIEPDPFPRHRVCGEFFSPECLSLLDGFGVRPPASVRTAVFTRAGRAFALDLPAAAGGVSRYRLDQGLFARWMDAGGARAEWVGSRAASLDWNAPRGRHAITLDSGTVITARRVVLACGRHSKLAQGLWGFPNAGSERSVYVGFKTHLRGLDDLGRLEMHFFAGGYLGISPVEDGLANACGLVRAARLREAGGVDGLLAAASRENPALEERLSRARPAFDRFLTVSIPPFGPRPVPAAPERYVLGDMRGAIAPLCGEGLSMALRAGAMAGQYVLRGEWEGFHRAWSRGFVPALRWGGALQDASLTHAGQRGLFEAMRRAPALGRWFYDKTRGRVRTGGP